MINAKNPNKELDKLKALLAKYSACSVEEISIDCRIGEDLIIIGDDAEEFFEEFSNLFGVDIGAMRFDEYFPSEGSSNMHYYLTSTVRKRSQNKFFVLLKSLESTFWACFASKKDFKTITVKHLIDIIESKRWG